MRKLTMDSVSFLVSLLLSSGQIRYGKAFVRYSCKRGQANQVLK